MHITKDIDRLLQEHNAEYVDMYEVGLSDEMMVAAIKIHGWWERYE